jgi:tetratricopeptide (TPR) repeat protein
MRPCLTPVLAMMLALACCGWVRAGPNRSPDEDIRDFPRPATLEALLELPADRIDLAWAALLVEKQLFPRMDADAAVAQVDELARSLAPRLAARPDPVRQLRAVNWHLFVRNRYRLDTTDTSGRAHSFYRTLRRRAGVCYGLSILHASVCQRLRLPVRIAELPGHVLARYEDGERSVNIETTQQGRDVPDRHYRERYGLRSEPAVRSLDNRAAVALFLLQTAGALYEADRPDAGLAAIRRSLELDPTSARAWYKMALIHEAGGARREEFACYERSLALRAEDPVVWGAKGGALLEAGRKEEAEAAFTRMLEIDARSSEVWSLSGSMLLRDGHRRAAERCYERALQFEPAAGRQLRERYRLFERAAAADGTEADAARTFRLAWILLSLDRHAEMIGVLDAVRRDRGEVARRLLARHRAELERCGAADPGAWVFAGMAASRFGDQEAAADCLAKADALGRVLGGR